MFQLWKLMLNGITLPDKVISWEQAWSRNFPPQSWLRWIEQCGPKCHMLCKCRKKDAESRKGLGCVFWWEPHNGQESEMGCCTAGLRKEHHRRKAARTWVHVTSLARQDIGKNRYDLSLFPHESQRSKKGFTTSLPSRFAFCEQLPNSQSHTFRINVARVWVKFFFFFIA